MNELQLTINGAPTVVGDVTDELLRAVIISLFTWRRARKDDAAAAEGQRMGWWGDAFAVNANDRIGSRLWLLARAKRTDATLASARGYAQEALQWLVDDGVALRIDVAAQRVGMDGAALVLDIYRNDGSRVPIRFDNLWGALNV